MMKKIIGKLTLGTLCVLAAFTVAVLFLVRLRAQEMGTKAGEALGTTAGRVIGSYEGFTEGWGKGYDTGKTVALTDPEIETEVTTKFEEVLALEVLTADGEFADVFRLGSEGEETYAALYSVPYQAVFSVDLQQANIRCSDGKLRITLPQPEVNVIPGEAEKKDEYTKIDLTSGTIDGIKNREAFANQLPGKVEEELSQNSSLMETARQTAKKQVEELADTLSLNVVTVEVDFKEATQQ